MTGTLGGSAAELARLAKGERVRRGDHPHLYPNPRVRVGMELVRRKLATAAIDLSDGISTDLGHLCAESGAGAELWADALPVHAAATLEEALDGGEDYELLFTAPAKVKVPRRIAGVAVTQVGTLQAARGVWLVEAGGSRRVLKPGGWEHFRKRT